MPILMKPSSIRILRLPATTLASLLDSIPKEKRNKYFLFRILESLNVKDTIMDKAKYSESKIVREQALLSLQKIMIQNWQSI